MQARLLRQDLLELDLSEEFESRGTGGLSVIWRILENLSRAFELRLLLNRECRFSPLGDDGLTSY